MCLDNECADVEMSWTRRYRKQCFGGKVFGKCDELVMKPRVLHLENILLRTKNVVLISIPFILLKIGSIGRIVLLKLLTRS
jgi:hypothetical protein